MNIHESDSAFTNIMCANSKRIYIYVCLLKCMENVDLSYRETRVFLIDYLHSNIQLSHLIIIHVQKKKKVYFDNKLLDALILYKPDSYNDKNLCHYIIRIIKIICEVGHPNKYYCHE